MTVLAGARVVTPEGVLDPGWVEIDGGRIASLGTGAAPTADATDLGGAWLVPGFIDIHSHGGGGFDVTTSAADMAAAVAFHRSRGVTTMLVSLVAAPVEDLCEQLGWIAELAGRDRTVVGAHLEGPFLAQRRCGAQNPAYLLAPDKSTLARLLAAGPVRSVTIAPELPGALELISDVVQHGAVAAVGHTDATYEQAWAGYAAGATLATHLCNGMRPMDHREPGPIFASLDAGAACEVINDGAHVHPAVVRLVGERPGRLVLISDAMAAAGVGDGPYQLGGRSVIVVNGEARVAATGGLAGSTLTLADALRRTVAAGLSVEAAVAAAATNPARVLGLDGVCGSIAVGLDADLVVLDDDLSVSAVMAQGQWCR